MTRICSVPGCGKPHYGRGLCDLHRDPPDRALKQRKRDRSITKCSSNRI